MVPSGEAAQAALGNNANTRTPPLDGPLHSLAVQLVEARQHRYSLQLTAQKVMARMRRFNREGKQAPYRVTACMWRSQKGTSGCSVVKTTRGATYSGLQICASVWHCPVCAARITNERRKEIADAIAAAARLGYKPVLVTLTARHNAHTRLAPQLAAMTKAHEALWRGEPAKRFKARYGVPGFIRNIEVTHSIQAGWHPHIHMIVFVPAQLPIADFANDMRARWERVAARQGLTMNRHGFDATDADSRIADYLAKYGADLTPQKAQEVRQRLVQKQREGWNEADELTRWHTKKGKVQRSVEQHLTPWQLLEFAQAGDADAARLFRRYAATFHGRRQLHWSDGLRELLGLEQEKSDEEAAQEELDGDRLLEVHLTAMQWQAVRGNDFRAELLALVERATSDEIRATCFELFGWVPQIVEPGATLVTDDAPLVELRT
jgi:hypothetical protein